MGGITSLIGGGMSFVSYAFMLYFIYQLASILTRKATHEARNIEIKNLMNYLPEIREIVQLKDQKEQEMGCQDIYQDDLKTIEELEKLRQDNLYHYKDSEELYDKLFNLVQKHKTLKKVIEHRE